MAIIHLHNTLYRKQKNHFSARHWHHHFPFLSCHPYDLQFGSFYAIGVSIHGDQSCCLHYLLSPSTTPQLVYPARFVMQPAVVITIMWSHPYHLFILINTLISCAAQHDIMFLLDPRLMSIFVRSILAAHIDLAEWPPEGRISCSIPVAHQR